MIKASLFCTDAIMAASVALITAAFSLSMMQASQVDHQEDDYMAETGYDIGLEIDESGLLFGDEPNRLEGFLSAVTPGNLNVSVRLDKIIFLNQSLITIDDRSYSSEKRSDYMTQTLLSSDARGRYSVIRILVAKR